MRVVALVFAVSLLMACSSGDRGALDLVGPPDATVAELISPDVGADTTPDATKDDVPADAGGSVPPDPAFTFEPVQQAACLPDSPYEEDRAELFRTVEALPVLDARQVVAQADRVWVGTSGGLFVKDSGEAVFAPALLTDPPAAVLDLQADGEDAVLVVSLRGVARVAADGQTSWLHEGAGVTAAQFCGDLYALREGVLGWIEGGQFLPLSAPAAPVTAFACQGGELWSLAGSLYRGVETQARLVLDLADEDARALAAGPDFVLVAASEALWRVPAGEGAPTVLAPGPGQLPAGAHTCLAVHPSGERWAVGHAVGLSTWDAAREGFEHFQSLRYLPANELRAVSFAPDGGLWAATPAGVARLHRHAWTLADKAEAMLSRLDAHFWRLGGIVTVEASFASPWSTEAQDPLRDDDNDGQWTQEALAALCYAYAATGDERYYERARRALESMMMLIDVPASDFEAAGLGRGFITRSIVRDDEGAVYDSKATQTNWHHVDYGDGHGYYWKDDTSSDETTGHFYGFPLYHDLCAKDEAERAEVAGYVTALAGTILDNNFQLLDLDGEVTTHAYWNPERLAVAVDGVEACLALHPLETCADAWGGGAFLNSVQILGAMLAAWHVSGETRFLEAYERLVTEHRYDELATFAPDHTFTWTNPAFRNFCDHELADLAFLTLLRYEPHAARRAQWAESALAAWAYEAPERNPLKVLSLVAALSESPGWEEARRTLREYPLDLRRFAFDLSHRKDYVYAGIDRHGDPQLGTLPPYDEIRAVRWDSNPFAIVQGGEAGRVHIAPTFWLLPYWGLRYYGALCAP